MAMDLGRELRKALASEIEELALSETMRVTDSRSMFRLTLLRAADDIVKRDRSICTEIVRIATVLRNWGYGPGTDLATLDPATRRTLLLEGAKTYVIVHGSDEPIHIEGECR